MPGKQGHLMPDQGNVFTTPDQFLFIFLLIRKLIADYVKFVRVYPKALQENVLGLLLNQ
jgi:hypothetical protein